uniref:Uncharacterized protein n=1 Tax=virus sp. ctrcb4 TaxID=2825824 RepID=A0A8S5RPM4_9VIRU|nr:MAG TPA: hypothetical protein [virus sp. ctrcb4]DAR12618.1 MAG TPA: hypothetical protein [Crassvirales sp.]
MEFQILERVVRNLRTYMLLLFMEILMNLQHLQHPILTQYILIILIIVLMVFI